MAESGWGRVGCATLGFVAGCGTLFLGSIAVCAGLVGAGGFALYSAAPVEEVVELARIDPTVIAHLGEPIEPQLDVSVELNSINGDTTGHIELTLEGPKGTGHLVADGVKQENGWHYDVLEVRFPDGEMAVLQQPDQ